MLTYELFFRNFMVRKVGDLNSLKDMSDLKQLPTGAILHILDNLHETDPSSVVPKADNPLLELPPDRMLFHNVTNPVKGVCKGYDESKVRILPIGVAKELRNYKTANTPNVKYVDIPELMGTNNIGCAVNYNPLFMCRIKGIQKNITLVNMVLSSVFNTIAQMPDKKHFIHLNWMPLTFKKEDFMKSFIKLDRMAYRYPEHHQYIVLLALYNYLYSYSATSFMENIPPELANNIILALTGKDKCLFYNLGLLKEINGVKNTNFLKIINQINNLANSMNVTDTGPAIKPVSANIIDIKPIDNKNVPGFVSSIDPIELKKKDEEYVGEIEAKASAAIEENGTLTPAQKLAAKKKAQQFKKVVVDGEAIEDILTKPPDVQITPLELDDLKNDDTVADKSMLKSSVLNIEQEYDKKLFKRDLVKTLASFNTQGMFLTNVETKPKIDALNKLTDYKVTYEDPEHKKHIIKFTLPIFDENDRCYVNGGLKQLTKQRVNLPIVKDKGDRVVLSTNYNKAIVQRNSAVAHSFKSYIGQIITKAGPKIKVFYGHNESENQLLAHDYHAIASKYNALLINGKIKFTFDYDNRFAGLKDKKLIDKLANDEKKYGTYFGMGKDVYYYIEVDGTVNKVSDKQEPIQTTILDELVTETEVNMSNLNEWVELSVLNKRLPVIFALCYRYGLTHMLQYLDVDYTVVEGRTQAKIKTSDVVIKFADKKLIIHRTPLRNSLLFAGLTHFKMNDIQMDEMDDRNIYYDLIQSKNMSINYLKGIDSFFELFVDPVSRDVLIQMKEPTNFKDLLIRATTLLSTDDTRETASSRNFRFRSKERYVGIIYNTMARAYSKYKYKTFGASSKFTINEYDIKKEILKDQLLSNVSIINPIEDLKSRLKVSNLGQGGRSEESFVINDRQFTHDSIGVVSEATAFNGTAGISAQTPLDPTIKNLRGMSVSEEPKKLEPGNILSVTSLLIPGVTNDD